MTWKEFWLNCENIEPAIWKTEDGKLWWMDETDAEGFGPYEDLDECREELVAYGEWLTSKVISEVRPRYRDDRDWISAFIERGSI